MRASAETEDSPKGRRKQTAALPLETLDASTLFEQAMIDGFPSDELSDDKSPGAEDLLPEIRLTRSETKIVEQVTAARVAYRDSAR
jgi:hypothetical protein